MNGKEKNMETVILEKALEIMGNEGLEKLSIRKITNALGYAPGIIYHYFKNKEDLVNQLLMMHYKKLLKTIQIVDTNDLSEDQKIKAVFKSYFKGVLEWSSVYRIMMADQSSSILKVTRVLTLDDFSQSPALLILKQTLDDGIAKGIFIKGDTIQISKVIWSAVFGLLFKWIVEEVVLNSETEALLDLHLNTLIKGIKQ